MLHCFAAVLYCHSKHGTFFLALLAPSSPLCHAFSLHLGLDCVDDEHRTYGRARRAARRPPTTAPNVPTWRINSRETNNPAAVEAAAVAEPATTTLRMFVTRADSTSLGFDVEFSYYRLIRTKKEFGKHRGTYVARTPVMGALHHRNVLSCERSVMRTVYCTNIPVGERSVMIEGFIWPMFCYVNVRSRKDLFYEKFILQTFRYVNVLSSRSVLNEHLCESSIVQTFYYTSTLLYEHLLQTN